MRTNLKMAIPGLLVILAVPILQSTSSAQRKHGAPPDEKGKERAPFELVINFGDPGDSAYIRDWSEPMDEKTIYNWGKSSGLVLNDDSGPVVDGSARFVAKYGSRVILRGLNRNRHYWMWIDFVTYRNPRKADILTSLEILINDRIVKNLGFTEMTADSGPLMIELPYDLSQRGTVEVLFKEHSRYVGFWGIWDIVVCDLPVLPKSIAMQREKSGRKDMPVKESVIEGRPPVKKTGAGKGAIRKSETPGKKEDIRKKPAEDKKDAAAGIRKEAAEPEDRVMEERKAGEKKQPGVPAAKKKEKDDSDIPGKNAPRDPGSAEKPAEEGRKDAPDQKKPEAPGDTITPATPKVPLDPRAPEIKKEPLKEDGGKK